MPPLMLFVAAFTTSVAGGLLKRWPLWAALLESLGWATALTLVIYSSDLGLSPVAAGLLIAVGTAISTWLLARPPTGRTT